MIKAYEEVIDFIAGGMSPKSLIEYEPSNAAKERISDLIYREKTSALSSDEKSELDHFLQLEHIIRLAKARAHKHLNT